MKANWGWRQEFRQTPSQSKWLQVHSLGKAKFKATGGPKAADDRAIGWLPPREERIETTCFCSARGGVTIERRGRYRKYLQREKEHM